MRLRHKIAAVGLTALILGVLFWPRTGDNRPEPAPLVLERVQALGELHTARHHYSTVFEHKTSLQPADWVRFVPAGASVVRSATRNRALVSVTGSVDAGVDLRRARVERSPMGLMVVLPAPRVYEPLVQARVHQVRRGAFWDDSNIALDAQRAARDRFREAAMRGGIVHTAREQARNRVLELMRSTGQKVEVRFEDAPPAP